MQQVFNILCQIQKLFRQVSEKVLREYRESNTSVVPVANKKQIPQIIANRNDNRREVWIYNDSNFDLFISPLAQAETNKDTFSLRIAPQDLLVMNASKFAQVYKKEIYGFWEDTAPVSARAMVTEFTMMP